MDSDSEDLWFIQVFHLIDKEYIDVNDIDQVLMQHLVSVAGNRGDWISEFKASAALYSGLYDYYKRTKEFDAFIMLVYHHQLLIKVQSLEDASRALQMMEEFQNEFSEELNKDHEQIYAWKINLSDVYYSKNNIKFANSIREQLSKKVINHKEICSKSLRVQLAIRLVNANNYTRLLPESINFEELTYNEVILFYRMKCKLSIRNKKLAEAKEIWNEWRMYLANFTSVPPVDHFNLALLQGFLLFKQDRHRLALEACKQLYEVCCLHNVYADRKPDLIILISLIHIELGNIESAEELLNSSPTLNLSSVILAYIKFQKHHFSEVGNG